MKILTVKITRGIDTYGEFLESDQLDDPPCTTGFWAFIKHYFKITEKTKDIREIYLTLHTTSSKWRIPVEVVKKEYQDETFPLMYFADGDIVDDEKLDKPLKPYYGKTIYLEMEYTV